MKETQTAIILILIIVLNWKAIEIKALKKNLIDLKNKNELSETEYNNIIQRELTTEQTLKKIIYNLDLIVSSYGINIVPMAKLDIIDNKKLIEQIVAKKSNVYKIYERNKSNSKNRSCNRTN